MAKVTINTAVKDAVVLLVSSELLVEQQILLTATTTQSYSVVVNGGSPFPVTGYGLTVGIPYTCQSPDQLMTVEIQAVGGGAIDNVTKLDISDDGYFNMPISSLAQFTSLITFLNSSDAVIPKHTKNNIYGLITDIPSTIVYYQSMGTVTGNIVDIPSGIQRLFFANSINKPSLSGTIKNIPNTLEELHNAFVNGNYINLTGSTDDFSTNFRVLRGRYLGNIDIDVANLPFAIKVIDIQGTGGDTSIVGSIASFPSTFVELSVEEVTGNSMSGNLTDLPSTMKILRVLSGTDTNTITGDVNNLPGSFEQLVLRGGNTISGQLSNVPSTVSEFKIDGNNTLAGQIEDLNITATDVEIAGNNTVGGDLAAYIPPIASFLLDGLNTVSGFVTPGRVISFVDNIDFEFKLLGNNTLSSAEVDDLIRALNLDLLTYYATGSRVIDILGNSQARTAASDSAYNALVAKGYTVNTNP